MVGRDCGAEDACGVNDRFEPIVHDVLACTAVRDFLFKPETKTTTATILRTNVDARKAKVISAKRCQHASQGLNCLTKPFNPLNEIWLGILVWHAIENSSFAATMFWVV